MTFLIYVFSAPNSPFNNISFIVNTTVTFLTRDHCSDIAGRIKSTHSSFCAIGQSCEFEDIWWGSAPAMHVPRMCRSFGDLTALALPGDRIIPAFATLTSHVPGLPSVPMAHSLHTRGLIHQMLLCYLTSECGPSSGPEIPANFLASQWAASSMSPMQFACLPWKAGPLSSMYVLEYSPQP